MYLLHHACLAQNRKGLNQSVLAIGHGIGAGADNAGAGAGADNAVAGAEVHVEAVLPVASALFEGPDPAAIQVSK